MLPRADAVGRQTVWVGRVLGQGACEVGKVRLGRLGFKLGNRPVFLLSTHFDRFAHTPINHTILSGSLTEVQRTSRL